MGSDFCLIRACAQRERVRKALNEKMVESPIIVSLKQKELCTKSSATLFARNNW